MTEAIAITIAIASANTPAMLTIVQNHQPARDRSSNAQARPTAAAQAAIA